MLCIWSLICVLPLLYKFSFIHAGKHMMANPTCYLTSQQESFLLWVSAWIPTVNGRRTKPIACLSVSFPTFTPLSSKTASVKLAMLRRAWNAFAQLLSINFEATFQCPVCGQHPETVVCDGTMLRCDALIRSTFPLLLWLVGLIEDLFHLLVCGCK